MRIQVKKDKTHVSFTPEEIIQLPFYVQKDGELPVYAGIEIDDAIRLAAFAKLQRLAGDHVAGRDYKYGSVDVVEGKIVVTFFENVEKIPDPPGGP